MIERSDIVQSYLSRSRWKSWTQTQIAGDASGRVYYRLHDEHQSVIVMDARPDPVPTTPTFAKIARHLSQAGLCAPEILDHNEEAGLMVLSDLGQIDFAQWLQKNPTDEQILYHAACDILVHLETTPSLDALTRMTPGVAGDMIVLLNPYFTEQDVQPIADAVTAAMHHYAPEADTLALRDFHAENLIWRPGETGMARVGLLDFQDAFLAPAGYDLMSLLRDARRDVDPQFADAVIASYIARTNRSDDFRAQLAILGVQRNLRILGVFGRLAQLHGKTQYLALVPRVWSNLLLDLDHPALRDVREVVLDCLPPPNDGSVPS